MILSDDQIRRMADTISIALGPSASTEEVRRLAAQVVARMMKGEAGVADSPASEQAMPQSRKLRITKKLILNALGPDRGSLGEKLKIFVAGRALSFAAISDTRVENLRSFIAIIDYADYSADFNRLKFELASLCEDEGFKALVQDIGYYGL
jgi:hypothetical protein